MNFPLKSNSAGVPSWKLALFAGVAVAVCLPGGAHAQADMTSVEVDASDEAVFDVITVTARRRVEDITDTPLAVTAFGKNLIETGALESVTDIVALSPNVSFEPGGDFVSSNIAVRGVSRERSTEEPGVGVYRDGVYVGGPVTSLSDLYDLEQVEVLRGPQAGLYGRNAVGGAVNIRTARPVFENGAKIDLQVSDMDRVELIGMGNYAFSETLAARLSFKAINQDKGFSRNVFLNQELDQQERLSARARVLWQPSDRLEVLFTGLYRDDEGQTPAVFRVGQDPRKLSYNTETPYNAKEQQFSSEVNLSIGTGTLTNILSYRSIDVYQQDDTDFSSAYLQTSTRDITLDNFFGELRYASADDGRFRYLVGATVLKEESFFNTDFLISVGVPGLGAFFPPDNGGLRGDNLDSVLFELDNDQDLLSFAAFAELTFDLTDRLTLDTSLRYTRDERDVAFDQATPGCTACVAIVGRSLNYSVATDPVFENWSPAGTLSFDVSDSVLLYGTVSTGFKAGGINEGASQPEYLPFDSETSISYEAGLKAQLGDRAQLALAAFSQTRKDALISVDESVIDPTFPAGVNGLGINAGKIESTGLEAELSARPLKGLDVNLAYGYLDASYESFIVPLPGGGEVDYSANQVPRSFKQSFSINSIYRKPLTDGISLLAYGSYSNSWDGYQDNANQIESESPELMNLRLGVEGDSWSFTGFVNNLQDTRYITYQVGPYIQLAPGRTWGVRVEKSF
nr:TonB-dependent receptor [uncultured Hyphomonas sp.]